jgi:hypothetical protein
MHSLRPLPRAASIPRAPLSMNAPATPRPHALVAIALVAAVANAVALAGGPLLVTFAGGFTVLCLLPGYLLASLVLRERDPAEADGVEHVVLALALGYAVMVIGGLAVHYLPGPVTPGRVLAGFDLALAALLVLANRRHVDIRLPRSPRAVWVHVALILIVGAAVRLPDLGYAEFQGDEATIMLKSAAAVQGRDDVLFIHKKGPAEILIPTLTYGLAGRIDETTARLPFALVTLAGLLALYQLGRSMFGARVGLVAALILAINGFFVAFGRIVQYQGVVFLMSTVALLLAWAYARDRQPRRWVLLIAVLVAVGLLAHYDAVFVLPPIAWLFWRRWRGNPATFGPDARAIARAVVISGLLLATFYVPMVLHPYFRESTWKYLFELRAGGGEGGLFHNTLPNALALSTFYNSTYYVAFLVVALAAAIALAIARRREGRPSAAWWATAIWFACGLVLYTQVIKSPRTHFHVAFPAWSLLAAVALDDIRVRVRSVRWRRVGAVALGGLYFASAWYVFLIFAQHSPEYRRVFPAAYPAGFWRPPVELPTNGWFGFPYRAGWKAIGQLYHEGTLQGTYWSNEEENVTDWYTRGAPRCDDAPRYYFIAEGVQDQRPVPADLAAAGYGEIGHVTTEGRRRIRIFERGAIDSGSIRKDRFLLSVEDFQVRFDREASIPRFEPGLPYFTVPGYVPQRVGTLLDVPDWLDRGGSPLAATGVFRPRGEVGEAYLLGYTLDTWHPEAGGEVVLTVYWQSRAHMVKDYSSFVHFADARDDTRTVAQSDGTPGLCRDRFPTTSWQEGRIYVDRHVLRVPADASPGRYALDVGLYDYETLERLQMVEYPTAMDSEQPEWPDHYRIEGIEVVGRTG